MKLKENKDTFLYKKLPLIFILCCCATIILRTVQNFTFIDRETGFFIGGELINSLLYIVIFAATLIFAVTAFISCETRKVTLRMKKDRLLSVVGCLLAVSFLFDSISSLFGAVDSYSMSSYGVSAFQSMMLSGTIPQFFQSAFAVFSALYFLIFTKDVLKGNANASKHRILAVAPVGWAGFRLVYRFVEQISFVRVSELFLELILLALMVMFFMSFAQVMSGVYVKNVRWRIVGLGLPAALISFTLNVSRLIFVLFSGPDGLYAKYPFKVSDFVFALFVSIIIVKLIRNENEPYEV